MERRYDGAELAFAFALSALSFAELGVLLGSVIPTSRSMTAVRNLLPLAHVITLLQDPWLGFGWNTNASLVVVGILASAVACRSATSDGNSP